jgi:hypothetical protein
MYSKVTGFLLLGLTLVMIGCGPSGVELTGKATQGGATFTPAEGEKVVVMLQSSSGQQYDGTIEADGTFKITGPEGVAPGTYNVSYMRYVPNARRPPVAVSTDTTWTVAPDKKEFTLEIK